MTTGTWRINAVLSGSIEPVDGGQPPLPDTGPLPFVMPSTEELRASPRLVFAHYFPPYPLSLNNEAGDASYYDKNYLNPDGESGKHSAYGGLLRDRPVYGNHPKDGDYILEDMKIEVQQAIDAGLDGFAVDILSWTSDNWTRTEALLRAATEVDPGFHIMLQPDMNGGIADTEQELADGLAMCAEYPSSFRMDDGRLVVSPFKTENKSADFYTRTFDLLRDQHGIEVAFFPLFVDWRGHAEEFRSVSVGYSKWGDRSPSAIAGERETATEAKTYVDMWMQPVAVQDARPRGGDYYEAENLAALRMSWNEVMNSESDWVIIPTWNDYSEGTSIAPSEAHGWSFLDVNAYYLVWWKMGSPPEIVKDVLYLTHRLHWTTDTPSYPQTELQIVRSSPESSTPRDMIEVMAFATGAGVIRIGGDSLPVDAGVSAVNAPLVEGTPIAALLRGGRRVVAVVAGAEVSHAPYVQNMEYQGFSSERD